MSLEFISYNVQRGLKIDKIAEWVIGKDPDIFCLQEFPKSQVGMFGPAYKEIFASSFSRDKQTYGELIGYKAKIPLLSAFCVDLGQMNLPKWISSAEGRRSALVAHFQTAEGEIIVDDVHLEWWAKPRYKLWQLNKVIQSTEAAADPATPRIITGDFNFSDFPGSVLRKFMRIRGYEMEGRFSTHRLFGVRHQVDYVANKNCKVVGARTERIGLSDHDPVLFTVIQNGG